jgi:transcriptional regulator of nitric oxide reductase
MLLSLTDGMVTKKNEARKRMKVRNVGTTTRIKKVPHGNAVWVVIMECHYLEFTVKKIKNRCIKNIQFYGQDL